MTDGPASLTALCSVVITWQETNPTDGRLEDHARTRWYPSETEARAKHSELAALIDAGEWVPNLRARNVTADVVAPYGPSPRTDSAEGRWEARQRLRTLRESLTPSPAR